MAGTILRLSLLAVSLGVALLVVPFLSEAPITILLFELVVGGGLVLFWLGRRFFSLRLHVWQLALMVLGLSLGLWLGLQPVRYHEVCCMFGYTVGQGYPFVALRHGMILNVLVSPGRADALMQQQPNQVWHEIIWYKLLANGLFSAYASLVPVLGLGYIVRLCTRLRTRAEVQKSGTRLHAEVHDGQPRKPHRRA